MPEFAKFLQLVTWIILPVLLLSVLVTLFMHYRSLRKKKSGEQQDENISLFETEVITDGDRKKGAHILLDHSGVIRQYQDKLSYHHARYAALQQDFRLLQSKYSALLEQHPELQHTIKNINMENTTRQYVTSDDPVETGSTENQELLDRIEQLDIAYQKLVSENKGLLEQLSIYTATATEKDALAGKWQEENAQLRSQVAEQGYMKGLLKEKKSQIDFLQQQVDEQVIQVHRISHEQEALKKELETAEGDRIATGKKLAELNQAITRQDEVISQLQADLEEKEIRLEEKESILGTHANEVIYLQTIIRETREQNELLQAELADNHDKVLVLEEQLTMEETRVVRAMQKLDDNQQLLRKFHRTLSEHIGEAEETQVIELKPVYVTQETEGWN